MGWTDSSAAASIKKLNMMVVRRRFSMEGKGEMKNDEDSRA
jgi:hypothetical protein